MLVKEIKEKYEEVLKNRNYVSFIAKTNKKGKVISFVEDNKNSDDIQILNATVYNLQKRGSQYEKIRGLKKFLDSLSINVKNLFIIFIEE